MNKKGIIIKTLIRVIFVVLFVVVAVSVISGITDNIVWAQGATSDNSLAICFSGATEHTMSCLDKLTGTSLFTVKSAKSWEKKTATSQPAMSEDGIYFGLGDHVCAFTRQGINKWTACQIEGGYPELMETGVAYGDNVVCVGGSKETLHCFSAINGFEMFQFKGNNVPVRPAIDNGVLYFVMGNLICKETIVQSAAGNVWNCDDNDCPDADICVNVGPGTNKDLVVGPTLVCTGSGVRVKCYDKETMAESSITIASDLQIAKRFDGDILYFSSANKLHRSSEAQIKTSTVGSTLDISSTISSPIEFNDEVICAGAGTTFRCWDKSLISPYKFSVVAGEWDARGSVVEPVVEGSRVYFGLGDKVCAYALDSEGVYECPNFTEPYCDQEIWCKDFDFKITDGLSTYRRPLEDE